MRYYKSGLRYDRFCCLLSETIQLTSANYTGTRCISAMIRLRLSYILRATRDGAPWPFPPLLSHVAVGPVPNFCHVLNMLSAGRGSFQNSKLEKED